MASILTSHRPTRTRVVLVGSPASTPAPLRDLPNLSGRLVDPANHAAIRAALGQVSALAGEYRARVGDGERPLVIVFELTELDQPVLAVLARLAQLGPEAGVQLVAASAQPWPLVVDHCPLGLLAAFTSRLAFGGRRRPAWWLSADIDD